LLKNTPVGVVHGDINFSNIIKNERGFFLIDFGDSYFGYLTMDLAISLCDTCFDAEVFISIKLNVKKIVWEYLDKIKMKKT
jgi:thiamine kinase-like enzyme